MLRLGGNWKSHITYERKRNVGLYVLKQWFQSFWWAYPWRICEHWYVTSGRETYFYQIYNTTLLQFYCMSATCLRLRIVECWMLIINMVLQSGLNVCSALSHWNHIFCLPHKVLCVLKVVCNLAVLQAAGTKFFFPQRKLFSLIPVLQLPWYCNKHKWKMETCHEPAKNWCFLSHCTFWEY